MKTFADLMIEAEFTVKEVAYLCDNLIRLIELVRADEREACAKVCEDGWTWAEKEAGRMYADVIRARGNT